MYLKLPATEVVQTVKGRRLFFVIGYGIIVSTTNR